MLAAPLSTSWMAFSIFSELRPQPRDRLRVACGFECSERVGVVGLFLLQSLALAFHLLSGIALVAQVRYRSRVIPVPTAAQRRLIVGMATPGSRSADVPKSRATRVRDRGLPTLAFRRGNSVIAYGAPGGAKNSRATPSGSRKETPEP